VESRQDYVDGMGTADDPVRLTATRVSAVAARLATELTRPGAGSPLVAMASARELSAMANEALQEAVDRARAVGHSWKEIGDVLETTRQAAFQRFGRPVDPRTGAPMTRVVLPGAAGRATSIFADIAAGNWAAARADFSDRMIEAVSTERLADGWVQMAGLLGRFERMGAPVTTSLGLRTIANVPLYFEAGEGNGRVTFDADGKVAGLFIRPVMPQ
jgi:Protein of unknown function (DUF3887)